ncbi:MAG: mechanosensitive ion channel domain-containing protein [Aquabacterium sp.]|jgi:small-conductance mechanosensitive channel|uniref:mechanosensitive ion channel family protein n=1 Tax=Aquabacterium sp. TaxID=1872578 RepID=UPI003BB035BC
MTTSPPIRHTQPLTADELMQLWQQLQQPTALLELVVFGGCLLLAWFMVRVWAGRQVPHGSVWFGHRIYDGVLFPLLALVLALIARRVLLDDIPLAVFRLVLPILVSLAIIRLTVKVLRAAFPDSGAVQVIERTVSWLAWAGSVLWITGILPLVQEELGAITLNIGASKVSVRSLIEGTLSAVLVLILSLSVSSAIESRLLRGASDNLSLRKIAANVIRVLLIAIGLIMALSAAGVDLTALSVLGGAIGVGLGFGLQKLASNYVSGFVILAERSLRIGDLVKVDNFEGRITDINTRYTVLRASTGREAIVPNELLITQRVENASMANHKLQLTTVVQVAYGTDIEWLRPMLIKAVAAVPRVVDDSGVYLTAFPSDGLELTISFWVADPESGQMNVRSDVNMAVLKCLNELGVDIPFAQQVLHLPPAATDALTAVAGAMGGTVGGAVASTAGGDVSSPTP